MTRDDADAALTDAGVACIEFDHFAIAVEDLEASVRFYRDALGFEEVERRTTRGATTSMVSAVMRGGASVFVLVQGVEPESQVTRFVRAFGQGVQHVAIRVESLRATLDELHKRGVEPAIDVIDGPGIHQAFLAREGPGGVRIELIERNGGEFSDDSVERLFRMFELGGLY